MGACAQAAGDPAVHCTMPATSRNKHVVASNSTWGERRLLHGAVNSSIITQGRGSEQHENQLACGNAACFMGMSLAL